MTEISKLKELLKKVSRTFALNIPLLPRVLKKAVTTSYLILRNADSIEDASHLSKKDRQKLLDELAGVIRGSNSASSFIDLLKRKQWEGNPEYLEVLLATPFIISQLHSLPDKYQEVITSHILRFIREIKVWVGRYDDRNQLHLHRLHELDEYCYVAAGIVGEMLTSLFACYSKLINKERLRRLRALEVDFAAALQLINIIKDSKEDRQEGRFFIPQFFYPDKSGDFENLMPIVTSAYKRLVAASQYVQSLPVKELGIRQFCLVPIILATATLVHLLKKKENFLAGDEIKISHEAVLELVEQAKEMASDNERIRGLFERLSAPIVLALAEFWES